MKATAVLAFAAIAFFSGLCGAETITPVSAEYEFEVSEDQMAKACHIVVLVTNLPAPESVNFKFIITRSKVDTSEIFLGFTLDVGDLVFDNGLPQSNLRKATLLSAAFVSPTFTSSGRLSGGETGDGGWFAGTRDANTARQFLHALYAGGYELSFRREGLSTPRTYEIPSGPPMEVRNQFATCMTKLQ